jgi:hypothetical protein
LGSTDILISNIQLKMYSHRQESFLSELKLCIYRKDTYLIESIHIQMSFQNACEVV